MVRWRAVKNWLRGVSLEQAAIAAGLVLGLAILIYPQNRGSRWQSVSGLTFSPDGKHLAIGVYSGRFRTLRERWYVSDVFHTALIADAADLPKAIVLGRDFRADIFNILPEIFIGPSVAFSKDGSILLAAGFDGKLSFWDAASHRELRTESTGRQHLRTIAAFRGSDEYLAAFRSWISIGDFLQEEGPPSRVLESGVNVQALACAPDGHHVAVGGRGELDLEIWDVTSGKRVEHLEAPPPRGEMPPGITALAYLPDGKTLVAANDREVRIVDLPSRKVTAVLPERLVLSVAVSSDGQRLATGRYDGVTLWDLTARKKTAIHLAVPGVESVTFSPDGSLLAAGSAEGTVHVWSVPNFALTGTWTFARPNDVGLAQFLRLFPLMIWFGVVFFRWRSGAFSPRESLLRV
jgi:WD40 repeat protein